MKTLLYLPVLVALFFVAKLLYLLLWLILEPLVRYWHRFRHPCPQCRSRNVTRVPQVYSERDASWRFPDEARALLVSVKKTKGVWGRFRILRRLLKTEPCAVYIFRTCADCSHSWCRSYTAFFRWWRLVYMVYGEPECFAHQPELFTAVGLDDPHSFLGQHRQPRASVPLSPVKKVT